MNEITIQTADELTAFVRDVETWMSLPRERRRYLLLGPPGSGRTMLARRLAALVPPLVGEDLVETAWMFYGSGLLRDGEPYAGRAPFRAPHHTCSAGALCGGGPRGRQRPGEVSLAHGGTLFLDEVPEWRKFVLDSVEADLAAGYARLDGTFYPAAPRLVLGAACPCPCGGASSSRRCVDSWSQIAAHRRRLRLDRGLWDQVVLLGLDKEAIHALRAMPV